MPSTTTENAGVNSNSAAVTWTPPTASDNSGQVTLTSTHNPGNTFTIGTTRVTYTATDPYSNEVTESFDVIVIGLYSGWEVIQLCLGRYAIIVSWKKIEAENPKFFARWKTKGMETRQSEKKGSP